MAYEDYNIRQFMAAWFKGDRSVMDDLTFNEVYNEYIDTSGLYEQEEFDKVAYIYYLNNRINWIKMAIKLQKEFMNNFDIPFIPDLEHFKKYGHIVFWNNDRQKFIETLEKVEAKEKRYISQVEKELKELKDMRLRKNKGEANIKQTRGGFIRTINSLGKIGYKIDYDKTMVEELSYMIKQQLDENEQKNNKQT